MSCKGCIFEEAGSLTEPCYLCKRNPDDNRKDNYYDDPDGLLKYIEALLGIRLLNFQKISLLKSCKRVTERKDQSNLYSGFCSDCIECVTCEDKINVSSDFALPDYIPGPHASKMCQESYKRRNKNGGK